MCHIFKNINTRHSKVAGLEQCCKLKSTDKQGKPDSRGITHPACSTALPFLMFPEEQLATTAWKQARFGALMLGILYQTVCSPFSDLGETRTEICTFSRSYAETEKYGPSKFSKNSHIPPPSASLLPNPLSRLR